MSAKIEEKNITIGAAGTGTEQWEYDGKTAKALVYRLPDGRVAFVPLSKCTVKEGWAIVDALTLKWCAERAKKQEQPTAQNGAGGKY